MEVYLIRHTQVEMAEPLCYGQTDMPVKESVFEEEAGRTVRALAGIEFDHVYCSPLQRATRLAAYCGYPDAERDLRLKELFMGDLEMVPFRIIPQEHLDLWYYHYMDIQMPGGESMRHLYDRLVDFFEELRQKPYKKAAVFYHGCAILCTRIWAGQLPWSAGFSDVTPFGGVEKIIL
jgi:alpha-ribazole phosphatase